MKKRTRWESDPDFRHRDLLNKRKRRAKLRTWFVDIKKVLYCSICALWGGVDDNYKCLDFHHLDPRNKVDDITRMVASRLSERQIIEEMDKCIPVCRNCHAKIDT